MQNSSEQSVDNHTQHLEMSQPLEMPALESIIETEESHEMKTPKKSSTNKKVPNAPKKKSIKKAEDTKSEYSKMSVAELKKLLEERKIDGRSKLTKKDSIIKVLELFDQDPENKDAIKDLVNEIGTPKKVANKEDDKKEIKTESKKEEQEKKKVEIELDKTQVIPKEEIEEISKKLKKNEESVRKQKKNKKERNIKKLAKQIIKQLKELSEQSETKDDEFKSCTIMELDRIKDELGLLLNE